MWPQRLELNLGEACVGARLGYHEPHRGVRPGEPVRFWNRLLGATAPVWVDFGDGSPPSESGDETFHAYASAGTYTVRFEARGPANEPVEAKLATIQGSAHARF